MNNELARRKFLFKVNEFYQEKDLQKFNCSKKNIKFKNGNLMVVWFEKNKKEILESNEDICKKIQEQYKRYREPMEKHNENKVKEFYQEKDLEKFNCNKKNIKFKSGSYMGLWFRENKKEIFKSNEDICKKIQKQYKQYRESLKKSFEERQKEKLSEFCKEEKIKI